MILRFANCELDLDRQCLIRDGRSIAVEPQVFDLVRLLAENSDRLVTRDEIVERVWDGRIVSDGAISARIASARKAVGDNGTDQKVIRTIQRRGLQMAVPVVVEDTAEQASNPSKREKKPTPGSGIRYISGNNGARLAFMVQGDGPPILRVDAPGWSIEGEQTSPTWRETADWLATHCRQLRYSTLWPDVAENGSDRINFDLLAKDIGIVADKVGYDRFSILSCSGGVHPALRFAARHPDRVEKMVIHGGYVEGRSRRTGTDSAEDVFRHMIDQGWQNETAQIGASFMLPYFPDGPLEAIAEGARIFQNAVPRETELALRDAVNDVDNSELLSKVTCPVLIVHGRHDSVHPVSEARRLAEGLPDAELWILEMANSLPVAGHPIWEEYKEGLLEFLTRDN